MHPTDTLLSLSHARIARAAAAGPRRATQPTLQSDQQHMARIAQADASNGTVAFGRLETRPGGLAAQLAQADPWTARHSVGAAIVRLNTLARADGILAQRIAEL